ncbi:Voltage dependent potassium channel [Parasponia andersonii]|uniref:Voltage dependent potassium channel n=1 Tax=Parasponia andersonii TaxID=3476 RepID=A0A2P5B4Y7_PARAD|nr:Voltage dependent potassium channel [Parasponia andersonii]
MKNSKVELSDQRPDMELDFPPNKLASLSPDSDFGFAFNESNFSDRVLKIEIVPDLPEIKDVYEGFTSNRKRKREEIEKRDNVIRGVRIFDCRMLDREEDEDENQDEEAVIEESNSYAGFDLNQIESNDLSWSTDSSTTILEVKSLYISSPILAAKSPFFLKLFLNGMIESEERHVTLRIHASEEAAFMDLLNFIYSNTLSAVTFPALLDVLMVADKYEVASCTRYCSNLLQNFTMNLDSALLYLELPSSVLLADALQPMTDATKRFLVAKYRDITKLPDEVLNLPLAVFEVVLSSDDLHIVSEDVVFDFVLKWTRKHYPKLEERHEIIRSRLGRLIRFPHMTCRKLKNVICCNDLDPEFATKVVLEALFFKTQASHRQPSFASEAENCHRFVARAYKYLPIKVMEFKLPHQHCIVYLDLKREECANLFPDGWLYTQSFHLGGQALFLGARCNTDQKGSSFHFGLFLGMAEKRRATFEVEYEFSARSTENKEFQSRYRGTYIFTGRKAVGCRDLFNTHWTSFIADYSNHFINGILHIRAELSIKQ